MGCWNATCMISNLPIKQGEKVLLFILEQNTIISPSGGGMCEATGGYRPLFLGIEGTYDEYGSIDIIDEDSIKNQTIKEEIINKLENGYFRKIDSEKEIDYSKCSLEELIRLFERGHIIVPAKKSCDFLSDKSENGLNFANFKTTGIAMIHYSLVEKLIDSLKNYDYAKNTIDSKIENTRSIIDYINLEGRRKSFYESKLSNVDCINDIVKLPFVKKYIEIKDEDLYNSMIQIECVNCILNELRKSWMLTSGLGSSSDIYVDSTTCLAEFILNKID